MRKGFLVSPSSPSKAPATASPAPPAAPAMGSAPDSPGVLSALQLMLEYGEFGSPELEVQARRRLAAGGAQPLPPLPPDAADGEHEPTSEAQSSRVQAARQLLASIFGSVAGKHGPAPPPRRTHGPHNDRSLDSLSVRKSVHEGSVELVSDVCFGCPCAECVPPMLSSATTDYGEVSPIGRVKRDRPTESIWCVRPPQQAGGPIILERRRNDKHEAEDIIETPYSRRVDEAIRTMSSGARGAAAASAQSIIQAFMSDTVAERDRKRAEQAALRSKMGGAGKGKNNASSASAASANSAASTKSRTAGRFIARDDPALGVYANYDGPEPDSVYGAFEGADVLHAPVGHRPPVGQPYCARHVLALHAMQSEELEAMSQEMAESMRVAKKASADPLDHHLARPLKINDAGFPPGSKDFWIMVADPHDYGYDEPGGWRTLAVNREGKWMLSSTAENSIVITVDAGLQRALDTYAANVECADELLAVRTIADRLALALLAARIPPRKNKDLQWNAPDFASASPLGEINFKLTAHTYDTAAVIATRMDTGEQTLHYHSIAHVNSINKTRYRVGQNAKLRSQYNERLLAAIGPPIADGALCGCKRCQLEAKKDEESNKATPAAASAGKAKPVPQPTASAWAAAALAKMDAMPEEQKDNPAAASGIPAAPTAGKKTREKHDAAAPAKSAARSGPDLSNWAASMHAMLAEVPEKDRREHYRAYMFSSTPDAGFVEAMNLLGRRQKLGLPELFPGVEYDELGHRLPGAESPGPKMSEADLQASLIAHRGDVAGHTVGAEEQSLASSWASDAHNYLATLPEEERAAAYRARIEKAIPDAAARECFHLLSQKLGMNLPNLFPDKTFEEDAVDAVLAASPFSSDSKMREYLKTNPPAASGAPTPQPPSGSLKDAAAVPSVPAAKARRSGKKGKKGAKAKAKQRGPEPLPSFSALLVSTADAAVPTKYRLWVEEMRAELDFMREDDRPAFFRQRAEAHFKDPAARARFNKASQKGRWGLPDLEYDSPFSCSDSESNSSGSEGLYYKSRDTPKPSPTGPAKTPAPAHESDAHAESSAKTGRSAPSKGKTREARPLVQLPFGDDLDPKGFLRLMGLAPPAAKRDSGAAAEEQIEWASEPEHSDAERQKAREVVDILKSVLEVNSDALDADKPGLAAAGVATGEHDDDSPDVPPPRAAKSAAGPIIPNVERDAAAIAAAFASGSVEAQMAYYTTPAHEFGAASVPLKPGVVENFASYFKAAQGFFAKKYNTEGASPSTPDEDVGKEAPSSSEKATSGREAPAEAETSRETPTESSTAADSQPAASSPSEQAEATASPPATQAAAASASETADSNAAPAPPAAQAPTASEQAEGKTVPSTPPPRSAHLKQYEAWASGAAPFTGSAPAAISPAAAFSPVSATTVSAGSSAQKSDNTACTSPPTSPSPTLVRKRSTTVMRQAVGGPLPLRGMPRAVRPLRAPHVEAASELDGRPVPDATQGKASADVAEPAAAPAVSAASSSRGKPATEAEVRAEMSDLAERMARLMPGPKAHNLERLTNPNLPDRGQPFPSRRL